MKATVYSRFAGRQDFSTTQSREKRESSGRDDGFRGSVISDY
jgi:hypothetical protein